MKRSYHTDIILQYKLGILPREIMNHIPSSTLCNWKNRDTGLLFGLDLLSSYEDNLQMIKDFHSKATLLKAAKALYFIYSTYMNIFETIKNKKKLLHRSGKLVIQTIDMVKDTIGQNKALRAFGITYQQYYAWKKKITCKISPGNLCRKVYHNQLTFKEVDVIKRYLAKPQYRHWNITPVFYQILRDKAAFFSRTTFYKYVNKLNLQRSRPDKKKYSAGIRSEAPKRILHMDVTIFRPLDHTRIYLYFLVDNFSRFILNWKASLEYSAKITFQNISEAFNKYNLDKIYPYVDLICDDGTENKGMVDVFTNSHDSNIRKLVAQCDILFSNSMVEAVNKRIKYDFLFTTKLLNIEQTIQYLAWAIEQYNNKPHSALYGLTPSEVFNGSCPDKDMFKTAIRHAAQKRKEVNMGQVCLNCYEKMPV
ncbi:MAG: transposase [Bacteroidales bacterium]|nr:transposase [Bacteroidales bacterium]